MFTTSRETEEASPEWHQGESVHVAVLGNADFPIDNFIQGNVNCTHA